MTDIFWPNLAPSTVKTRLSFLNKHDINALEDYTKLRNTGDIVRKVVKSTDSATTRRNRISYIIEFLKLAGKNNEEARELLEDYTLLSQPILKEAFAHQNNNRLKDDPRRDRYLPLADLKQKWKNIPDNHDKLLLSLYINDPPQRNQYYDANIIHDKKDIDWNRNNILIGKGYAELITRKYKTYHLYGDLIMKLSKPTFNLIKKLGFFKLGEENLKKRLRKASMKYFGQPLSINNYRSIFEKDLQESERYKNMTLYERRKAHEVIGHSLETAIGYNKV